jgi:hypothetical protein
MRQLARGVRPAGDCRGGAGAQPSERIDRSAKHEANDWADGHRKNLTIAWLTAPPIAPQITFRTTAMPSGVMQCTGLEQGLDRVGDKILAADHGVKGGFAAA